ncbi:UPF0149 family protein [Vibrio profundum]|uniref:UPF0149 family protein n=1 Tax=Vibrio profundum TaxID=2910247 RepID=UPI003D125F2B
MSLHQIINSPELESKLLNEAKTQGFVAAIAAAPHVLPPEEWLPMLWGGTETAPFSDGEQLEAYIDQVIAIWNNYRPALLENKWTWPETCQLDDEDIVNQATRDFCEGVLTGWQLTQDDWDTLMPADSENSALLGGVILSLSMLYDPETSIVTLKDQGIEGLEQFEEIFNGIPTMLCGLSLRAAALVDEQ